jgi:probable F420-dependent oxidoreductase
VERPFRFGVQQYRIESRTAWQETARRAEALGYDILVFPDHIGELHAFAPALLAAADVTTSLRIGTLVLDNNFRHPALVAADTMTLDVLSDGRFELGIGAGWMVEDYERSGIPFDPPGLRVERLEESIAIIRQLFSGSPVSFSGRHYSITNLSLPKPVQQPHPPLLIGAGGRHMLRLAVRQADIINVMPPGVASGSLPDLHAATMVQAVEQIRADAGARIGDIELSILIQRVVVTDDLRPSAEAIAENWRMSADDASDSPWALMGTVEQIADTLRERRQRFGLSYMLVHDRFMDDFAPIIAVLSGT